ncbi:MAG: hypothetical protein AAGB93_04950 [Planctomycetota bacterium]
MRMPPLALLLAAMVGAFVSVVVTVIVGAYALGGPGGYVTVVPTDNLRAHPPVRTRTVSERLATHALETADVASGEVDAGSVCGVTLAVRDRLADPAYVSHLLRDEPSALRFLFETSLDLERPDEAWSLLERHGVFAAHLEERSWRRMVTQLETSESEFVAAATESASALFGR